MNNDAYLKKRQALEALDYIDDDIISGVLGKIKSDCATVADTTRTWRTPLKYWKQFAALAACLILLSVASPLVSYVARVISDLGVGAGSSSELLTESEVTNGMYDKYVLTEEDLAELNEAYAKWIDGAIYADSVEEAMTQKTGPVYIGKFNECIAFVYIDNPFMDLYPDIFCVCFESEIYLLEDAHENGWISDDDLDRISEIYDRNIKAEGEFEYGLYLNPIKDLEPLPKGLLEEIDLNSKFGFSSFSVLNRGIKNSDRYLGNINGYYVFFNTSAGLGDDYLTAAVKSELHVAGYDFYYSSPFSILLYKDGTATNLKKAYESGLITQENVRKIYCRNNEYLRYFDSELNFKDKDPISEETFDEIREAWISKYGESVFFAGSFEATQYFEHYFYGYIGDNVIFHAGNPDHEGNNERLAFEIEGHVFSVFSKAVNIWVYRNGEIMLLQDAYDRGLVVSDDLPTISYMNQCVIG